MFLTDPQGSRIGSSQRVEVLAPPRTATRAKRSDPRRAVAPPSAGPISRLGLDVVPMVLVIDCLALVAAALIMDPPTSTALLLAPAVLLLNLAGGHYRPRIAPSLLDQFPSLLARALVAGAVVTSLRAAWGWEAKDGPITTAVLFVAIACVGRAIGYPIMRRARVVGRVAQPTIIIGCGRVGNQLARTLLDHPEYGMQPVGCVDDSPLLPEAGRSIPLLGGTESLSDLLLEHRVHNVIVAFSSNPESTIVDVLRTCDRMRCEIFLVPRFYELHGAGPDTDTVWGLPLVRLRRTAFRTFSWRLKRVFDVVLSSLGLVLLSPVLAACALAVRLEGGPKVIFRQERVGLDGRPFELLKFRSLPPGSESDWTIEGDPRLGRVGRLLRRTSLDELPQLWNVVRGDMSLVGPRPERPHFVEEFTRNFPWYMARHRVPSGITGWAQVNGLRGNTDISDRARFDNYYIENWSLWTDVKIILRTVAQVVGARGR